jgi:hypothetical protein
MINKTKTYLLSILILLLTSNVQANDGPMTIKSAFLLGHSIEGMVVNNHINETQAENITWTIATVEASNLEFMGYRCVKEIKKNNAQFCKSAITFMLTNSDDANHKICTLRGALSKESLNFRCGSGWRW